MHQLMFNTDFSNIIEEPSITWKTIDDVPLNVKRFVFDNTDKFILLDKLTNQFYCSKCTKKLNDSYYCEYCKKQYQETSKDSKYLVTVDIKDIRYFSFESTYYTFVVKEDEVFLVVLENRISYNHPSTILPQQLSKLFLKDTYQVLDNGLYSIFEEKILLFKNLEEEISKDLDYDLDLSQIFEIENNLVSFVDIESLQRLKNTKLYKYTYIWEASDYFQNHSFTLSSLTYYPLYCKQFEYLIKLKFYRIALTCPYNIEYKNSFEKTFGLSKNYYSFMVAEDISYSQLEALRLYPTTDISIVNFIDEEYYIACFLNDYLDLGDLKKYFEQQNLTTIHFVDYYDYITFLLKLGYDIKDKKLLFPEDFVSSHDQLTIEVFVSEDPEIDQKINNFSKLLSFNIYEDDKYIIFPADCIKSLIQESTEQRNCVKNYCSRIAENECQIYFLRKKEDSTKSFVTIEVRNGKVVQARTKYNELPSKEVKEVLKKWEKQLLIISKF